MDRSFENPIALARKLLVWSMLSMIALIGAVDMIIHG